MLSCRTMQVWRPLDRQVCARVQYAPESSREPGNVILTPCFLANAVSSDTGWPGLASLQKFLTSFPPSQNIITKPKNHNTTKPTNPSTTLNSIRRIFMLAVTQRSLCAAQAARVSGYGPLSKIESLFLHLVADRYQLLTN